MKLPNERKGGLETGLSYMLALLRQTGRHIRSCAVRRRLSEETQEN